MNALFLMSGLLLSWSIFQYSEGAGNDECPEPDTTKFAEYHIDWYIVGTWARYYCNPGSQRAAGVSNIIRCKKISGVAQWTDISKPLCIALPSTGKWETSSIGPQISTSNPTAIEGFCGPPVPLKHTTVKVMKYKVGQELKFKGLNESQAEAPINGIMTCENSTGIAVWSSSKLESTDCVHWPSGKQCLNPAILFILAAGMMVFIL
ncbi:uncharacterized protein LOC116511417 [Thamnophis elegans]|uniref:uncharacterized protein LOC116511417 n=1 Tax=Thamnophis elegans TaxID=35005 RepID=UPI0013789515|nr:uncharacterized protein LOC116511417 [Thamnophis elegans]